MEHINVVLQPGENRDLAANGQVWINVTDEEQPRVGLACAPCDRCHGWLTGREILLLAASTLPVVWLGAASAWCLRQTQTARVRYASPFKRDIKLRIDRKYATVAKWQQTSPLTMLILALTVFVPVLVTLLRPATQRPAPPYIYGDVEGSDSTVTRAQIWTELAARDATACTCGSEQRCWNARGEVPCSSTQAPSSIAQQALQRGLLRAAPWNCSDDVCGQAVSVCPFDGVVKQCRASLVDGECQYETACDDADVHALIRFMRTEHLPRGWRRLAEFLLREPPSDPSPETR
jgi:hypothetical protein